MRLPAAIGFCVLLISTAYAESPQQQLKTALHGKTVFIRGFYQDDRLEYTAQGEVMGTPQPGSWTVAQMQVNRVAVRQDRFEVSGPRVITYVDHATGEFRTLKPSRKHTIRITLHVLPATLNQKQLGALIQKVFVTEAKPDISVFPPYWREFLSGNMIRSSDKDGKPAFKRQDETIADAGEEDRPVHSDSSGEPVFHVSERIEAPKVQYQIDPEYSESARAQKFSGRTVVSLEVDRSGAVHDIQIVQPVGYGLDDQAVRAVQQWRFSPARRNGEPVAVLLEAEVSFSVSP